MVDSNRKNILILDPDRDMSELFARALETCRGSKCYLASEEDEVLALLKEVAFCLLLADLGLIMVNDFSLLRKVRRLFPQVTVVVDTFLHQRDGVSRAMELGALGYILKPIQIEVFRKKIRDFLSIRHPGTDPDVHQ